MWMYVPKAVLYGHMNSHDKWSIATHPHSVIGVHKRCSYNYGRIGMALNALMSVYFACMLLYKPPINL